MQNGKNLSPAASYAGMLLTMQPRTGHNSRLDTLVLIACASVLLGVNLFTGGGYGFHRDELQFLDAARHLQWGFVAYPPLTSLVGRIAIGLFGISPQVLRLPVTLANGLSLVLTGLVARELGARLPGQLLALFAVFPLALVYSSVLQYDMLDHLAWVLIALFTAKLLRTGNPRWWLPIGASVGLGMESKYSIAAIVFGLVAGLIALPS